MLQSHFGTKMQNGTTYLALAERAAMRLLSMKNKAPKTRKAIITKNELISTFW
jgi:hypothetical protein